MCGRAAGTASVVNLAVAPEACQAGLQKLLVWHPLELRNNVNQTSLLLAFTVLLEVVNFGEDS